jgi:hypothetical protein
MQSLCISNCGCDQLLQVLTSLIVTDYNLDLQTVNPFSLKVAFLKYSITATETKLDLHLISLLSNSCGLKCQEWVLGNEDLAGILRVHGKEALGLYEECWQSVNNSWREFYVQHCQTATLPEVPSVSSTTPAKGSWSHLTDSR